MKIDINTGGLNKLSKKTKKLGKNQSVAFDVLFNDKFMYTHTQLSNIQAFFEKSGFEFESEEDFEKIPEKEFDEFVSKNTKFSSWGEMLTKASAEYFAKQLGL